jgi:DNA-binding transcriptional ArsR family regulator
MGRANNKYRLRRDVFVPWDILDSEAFDTLSVTGIKVLLRFLQKRKWAKLHKKTVYMNGGLSFTYAEAEGLGISTAQFHRTLKKLYEVGFVDIEHQGGGVARDYSRYALSNRWKNYGTDSFKPVEKKRVLWSGFDVQARMQKKLNKTIMNDSC